MKKKEILKEQKKIKAANKQTFVDINDNDTLKKIIFITFGVLVFFTIVFVCMNIFNGTWNLFTKKNDEKATINSSLVMCGTMFNRSDSEYLVLAYNINNDDDKIYAALASKYSKTIPLYNLDLESGFNKSCIGDKSNFVNDSTKFKFSTQTLLHIKNGKIVDTYTTKSDIQKYLSN